MTSKRRSVKDQISESMLKPRKRLLILVMIFALMLGCGSREQVDIGKQLREAQALLSLNRKTNEVVGYLQSTKGTPAYYITSSDMQSQGYFDKKQIPPNYQKAREVLEEAIRLNSESDEAYVLLGILYSYMAADVPDAELYLCGDSQDYASPKGKKYLAKATEMFERALKINPQNKDAYWGLVLRDSKPFTLDRTSPVKDIKKSITICRKLLKLDPANIYAQANLGIFLLRIGHKKEAEETIDDLVARHRERIDHPKIVEALYALGKDYLEDGKTKLAERTLKQAVNAITSDGLTIPTDDRGYYFGCPFQALGDLYAETRRGDQAMKYYLEAADYGFTQTLQALETVIDDFSTMNYQAANKRLDHVFRLRTNDPAMRRTGDALLSRGHVVKGLLLALEKQYEAAAKEFDIAEKMDSKNIGAVMGRGHLQISSRNPDKAEELFHSVLSESTKRLNTEPESQKYNGLVYRMTNLGLAWTAANSIDHEKALPYFDKVLEYFPNDLLAMTAKSNSLIALGRVKEAEKLIIKALSIDPKNRYALAAKATVDMNKGDARAAEAEFKQAKEEGGANYTCPYEGLGLLYLQQGKIDMAKAQFDKAVAINPAIEYRKFIGLAKIYIMEGRRNEAEKMLRKALENDPENKEALNLLNHLGLE